MKKEKKEKLPKWVTVEEVPKQEQAPEQHPKDPPGTGKDD